MSPTNSSNNKSTDASTPLISVVTVVYNRVGTLARAMDSVLNQTHPRVEYVVVDGGSTDGSLDVLAHRAGRLAAWVSEPDRGISDAINKGIAMCSGTAIGLLHADDWYEPDAIARAAAEFAGDSGGTGGAFSGIVCGRQQYWAGDEREYVFDSDPELLPRDMTVNHASCFVHREVYRKHGLFREDYRYAMDYELMLRFKTAGVEFRSLPLVLSNMSRAGVSDRRWRGALAECHRARQDLTPDSPYANRAHYARVLTRAAAARTLDRLGLNFALDWYRQRFSLLKKTR